ncbi:MAG: toxin-antitoxin system, antitoxin component [Arcobacter sp.]|nr:toxin-antitoxin system, antitoxin component [Arcobacter sp.]
MPQISLYVDNETLQKVEHAAKLENKSISKWVSSKLKYSLQNNLPDEWLNLFGSLKDDSFIEQPEISIKHDAKREKL